MPADSACASPPVRKASWVPGGALCPSGSTRTKSRFGSRTEDFTLTRTLPAESGGKVEAIGRGGAAELAFASGARAGTTDGRRSGAGATEGGAEGGWLVTGEGGALEAGGLAAGALGGTGGMLAAAGGELVTAGMVPDVPVDAAGGIGGGTALARADGGGGGVLDRAEGGGGGLERAGRAGCWGSASGGRDQVAGGGGGGGGGAATALWPWASRFSFKAAAAFARSTARASSPASPAASAARLSQRSASVASPFCQMVLAASSATATSLASEGSGARIVSFESSVKTSYLSYQRLATSRGCPEYSPSRQSSKMQRLAPSAAIRLIVARSTLHWSFKRTPESPSEAQFSAPAGLFSADLKASKCVLSALFTCESARAS